MSNLKKSYSNPELKVHGNVEILTQATGKKGKLDKDFPAVLPSMT